MAEHSHQHETCQSACGCSCGQQHKHEHEHEHEYECSCGHTHESECGCGCGCGHEHEQAAGAGKKLMIRVAAVVVLSAAGLWIGGWAGVVLFVLAYLAAGYDVVLNAGRNILRGKVFDEHFLMTVASLGAMLMGEYAEAAAVMTLYQVGEYFQGKAVAKSRASIAGLMNIRPEHANRLRADETVEQVCPEEIGVGEMILIKPGERVPLDGIVAQGESTLDTRALTGESLPREVRAGEMVISGCINETAVLRVKVTAAYHDSTVAKILELVEHSGQAKAKTERFISRFARVYTPAVCLAALLLAVVPSLVTGQWSLWISRALTFLVISCPCALVISVPLTFFSGIGAASRKGILIKGANYLESLARTSTVVFDKTGTLTQGVFKVTQVHPEGVSKEALLEAAALAECWSDHPVSRSLKAAWGKEIDPGRVTAAEEIAGFGVKATVDGRIVYAGNARLMARLGLNVTCAETGTAVHVAVDGVYWGCAVLDDVIRPQAVRAIEQLRQAGVGRMVMLTGDNKAAADAVAQQLKLTEVHAQLLPGDKVAVGEELLAQSKDGACVFCGDGINDAPVLRRADVGVAMGAMGSQAAIEAADVVLMDDDPLKLPLAIRIARRTMGIAWQNIVFALGVKILVMLLGALGLSSMWLAVFADVGVALLAVMNAMRAMQVK